MGSKDRYLDIINNKINSSKKDIYVEYFLGSGIVFFNLQKNFKEYHLAEKDRVLLNCYKQIIYNIDPDEAIKYFNTMENYYKYNTYDGFYKYREYFNEKLWKTDSKEEALGIIILVTICINNMYRFGNNGFNSSYGDRFLTEFKKRRIKLLIQYVQKFKKNINFYEDYRECLNIKNSCCFIDPPYFKVDMANSNGWNENELKYLLNNLDYKNDIIYTDIKNKIGDKFFNKSMKLDKLKNISPNRKEETLHDERLYFNF
jgi:hypothetical protein